MRIVVAVSLLSLMSALGCASAPEKADAPTTTTGEEAAEDKSTTGSEEAPVADADASGW